MVMRNGDTDRCEIREHMSNQPAHLVTYIGLWRSLCSDRLKASSVKQSPC
jgi:hypothetical protein